MIDFDDFDGWSFFLLKMSEESMPCERFEVVNGRIVNGVETTFWSSHSMDDV